MPPEPTFGHRPTFLLVYNKQNPRWEAPGHGPRRQFTKPYKPARQPPDSLPPRQHRPRPGSRVLDRFVVLGLVGIVITALAAQWLSAYLRLPPAWFPLLCGLVLGPVTGLIDPVAQFGTVLQPLLSLFFVVLLVADLLQARGAIVGNFDAGARLVGLETVIICAGTAVIAAVIGVGPAPAALLAAILVIAQGADRGDLSDEMGALHQRSSRGLEIVGIALALIVCEVALAAHLYRDHAPAVRSIATALIGGSLAGVVLGYLLTQSLRRASIPEGAYQPLLWVVALTTFALTNLLHEGCGFFAVLALGLYLAHQRAVPLAPPTTQLIVPPALISGLLVVLAAQVHLDAITALDAGGLTALVALLLVGRLVTWRGRLPWHVQLALTGDAPATAIVVGAAVLCAARLGEVGVPQVHLVVALSVLVVFIRLSVASVAGVFGTRWWHAAVAPPKAPGQQTPVAL